MHVGSVLVFEGPTPGLRRVRRAHRARPAPRPALPPEARVPAVRRRRGRCGSTTRTSTRATTSATPRCRRRRARTSSGGWPAACSPSSSTARSRCGRSGSSTASADGRFALICKTHHALVDGISGVDIMTVLFDLEPDPPEPEPGPKWAPRPPPSGAEMLAESIAERVTAPVKLLRDALAHPDRAGADAGKRRRRSRVAARRRDLRRAAEPAQHPDRPAPALRLGRGRPRAPSSRPRTRSAARSTTPS